MKALRPLNFLTRHLQSSHSYPSLPLPFLFHRAHLTRLSITRSNRILPSSQTRYSSTVTSSEDAIQNKTSTQNTERASTFVAIKPADNSFFLSDEALYGREPTSVHPTGTFCPTEPKPGYHLTFTCKPCGFRSTHSISKQGYHNGTVLITCPDCKNRHVISDHLKIFYDLSITIEDILREKGETLKRGTINSHGDVEFLPDPSEVPHVDTLTEDEKVARLEKDLRQPKPE